MTTTGVMTRGRIAIIVAVLCFSCAVCEAEKCPPSEFQYDGLYVCWDADTMKSFEDLSVTDNPPTNRTAAIFSGADAGAWFYVRIERGLHKYGWNFEGEVGTFTKGWSGDPDDVTTLSVDRGNITYIIGACAPAYPLPS